MNIVNSNYINENKLENIVNASTTESMQNLENISNNVELNQQNENNPVNLDPNTSTIIINQGIALSDSQSSNSGVSSSEMAPMPVEISDSQDMLQQQITVGNIPTIDSSTGVPNQLPNKLEIPVALINNQANIPNTFPGYQMSMQGMNSSFDSKSVQQQPQPMNVSISPENNFAPRQPSSNAINQAIQTFPISNNSMMQNTLQPTIPSSHQQQLGVPLNPSGQSLMISVDGTMIPQNNGIQPTQVSNNQQWMQQIRQPNGLGNSNPNPMPPQQMQTMQPPIQYAMQQHQAAIPGQIQQQGIVPGQMQQQQQGAMSGQMQHQTAMPGQMYQQSVVPGQMQLQSTMPGQMQQHQGAIAGQMQQQGTMPGQMQHQGVVSGQMQQQGAVPGQMQNQGAMPGQMQQQGAMPGQMQQQGAMPGQMQQQGVIPGQILQQGAMPGQMQQQGAMPGQMQQQGAMPGQMQHQQAMYMQMQQQQGMAMQQGQSSFAGTKFSSKPWHHADHLQVRTTMIEEIIQLLKTRRPNATEDWHEKLPHMAKRLEDALYHEASTLEEYSDNSTLKSRLQQLALSMGGNKTQPGKQPTGQPQQVNNQIRQQQFQQQQQMQQKQYQQQMQQFGTQPQQFLPQVPRTNDGQSQQAPVPMYNNSIQSIQSNVNQGNNNIQQGMMPNQHGFQPNGSIEYQQQQQIMQGQPIMHPNMNYNGNPSNPNMNMLGPNNSNITDVNQQRQHFMGPGGVINQQPNGMIMNGQPNGQPPQAAISQGNGYMIPVANDQSVNALNYQNVPPGNAIRPTAQIQQNPQLNMGQVPNNIQQPNQANSVPTVPGHTEEHRKQVLKQQQQRLLLLRHASKCPHDNGSCPVTPHCWSMKQLWKHIMSCKDQECKIPHCVSSRYVLSHYSKCKEPTCPVCGPVREAIKRNYERSREVVKMTRNPYLPSNNGIPGQPSTLTQGLTNNHPPPQRDEPPAKKQKKEKVTKEKENKKDAEKAANAAAAAATSTIDEKQQQSTTLVIQRPRPAPVVPRSIYPLDPISCAIYSFTAENIQAHFKSVHEGMKLTVAKIKEMCKPILEDLFKVPHAYGVFGTPVDPVALGLSDYLEVVRIPMDLGTVSKRLDGGSYRDLHNFVTDIHLTFDNAMNYNPKNSDVHMLAKSLKREFDNKYRQRINEFEKALALMRENPDGCLICGEPSLKFEPPVYYCNGVCAQRIRRNAVFYSNNTNAYHWCSPCFNSLKDSDVSRQPDCTITKSELAKNKKKHTEESEEGWVQCESCQRWVHQVCSLFNARRNISDEIAYVCPVCIQDKRKKNPELLIVAPTTKKMRAADLPVTVLSQFLEDRIYKRLAIAYKENAAKLGISENDIEKCPILTLRQVSSQDKMHTVREGVYNRYKEKGYPTDFPCRSKCLVLFQNIDGQDVILFGMYVYEYGHNCPQPNQRRVYVSYLDSVHYLRPKQYRTLVYHEILISYLDYVKARGFHTAHIWACPPQKGDDYILYVHPPDQKTPKPQILRVWYDEMLKRCVERGIVTEVTDIHTEYLLDHSNDATVLPYFEGDYWVNEAEVIIKNLGSKGTSTEDNEFDYSGGNKSKRKSKTKRIARTVSKATLVGKSERDPVMSKLASIIEPMKDTFFVARLHPKEYAEKFAEKLKAENNAESVNETIDQRDKLIKEEALSGGDVQMPEGATVTTKIEETFVEQPNSSSTVDESSNEEISNDVKDDIPKDDDSQNRMEDDEDDFGKAAFAISMSENVSESIKVDSFTNDAIKVAQKAFAEESGNDDAVQLDNSEEDSLKIENVDEKPSIILDAPEIETAPIVATPTAYAQSTPTSRGTRSTRQKPGKNTFFSSDVKIKSEETSIENNNIEENEQAILIKNEEITVPKDENLDENIKEENIEVKEEVIETKIKSESDVIEASSDNSYKGIETPGKMSNSILSKGSSLKVETDKNDSNNVESSDSMKIDTTDNNGNDDDKASESHSNNVRTPIPPLLPPVLIMCGEDMPKLPDDTEDVDDTQENEHFETRQSFLNLCQGNHYQFDQLRRAKHTSMMVLYHLHNPDAPKFVPSCSQCHIDILTGNRHHCDTCEIDYCQNCVNSIVKVHNHPLRPIAVASSAPQQLTEEQRRQRQHSVRLHMELLLHAANCNKCESKNCQRMKEFLKHDSTCTVKASGGCRLCARISNLLKIHSTNCRIEECKVPHCLDMREQLRKLNLRQQQMDDRRRKNMNFEYGRAGSAPEPSDD